MDSVKTGEREKIAGLDLVEPASAEIEISTTLFPWYANWLWRETAPGKPVLQKHRAIYGAVMEARQTLGYGSHQTIRGYLKTFTNPMNGPFQERYDPNSHIPKWIERRPETSSLDDVLEKALYNLDRQRFLKAVEETDDRRDALWSDQSDPSSQPETGETGEGKKAEGE